MQFRPLDFNPEESARWIIQQIEKEAEFDGSTLSDWDFKVLSSSILDFADNERHLLIATHNLAVESARSAIERAKGSGVPLLKVREGLIIPQEWEDHYETLYETEFPWIVSTVMQSAFMGNPFADETEPWTSM